MSVHAIAARHIGKIVLNDAANSLQGRLREDRTYLVTGGLGWDRLRGGRPARRPGCEA